MMIMRMIHLDKECHEDCTGLHTHSSPYYDDDDYYDDFYDDDDDDDDNHDHRRPARA